VGQQLLAILTVLAGPGAATYSRGTVHEGLGMTDSAVIGMVGRVVVATRGRHGPGEVQLSVGGVRECYIASSDAPIERGESVLVVEVAPHRQITVVPWSDFPVPAAGSAAQWGPLDGSVT